MGYGYFRDDYLMESGSDRIGALDFQASPSVYLPRSTKQATLGVWAAEHFDRIPTELFDTVFDSPL